MVYLINFANLIINLHAFIFLFISFVLTQKKRTKEKVKEKRMAPPVFPANAHKKSFKEAQPPKTAGQRWPCVFAHRFRAAFLCSFLLQKQKKGGKILLRKELSLSAKVVII
jgi:hypothetical protein